MRNNVIGAAAGSRLRITVGALINRILPPIDRTDFPDMTSISDARKKLICQRINKHMDIHLINDLNALPDTEVSYICRVINKLIFALNARHETRKDAYPARDKFEPDTYMIYDQQFGPIKKDQDTICILSQIIKILDRPSCSSSNDVKMTCLVRV